MTIQETFRANLRNTIAADGRSLTKIAKQSGFSRNYIMRLLAGAEYNPTLLFLECMATTLGITAAALITPVEDAPCKS